VKHPDIAHANAVGDIKRRFYRLRYVIIDHEKLGGLIDRLQDFSIIFVIFLIHAGIPKRILAMIWKAIRSDLTAH